MVSSAATTVAQYLSSLPTDRRRSIERVRGVVNQHLPGGYVEGMLYGMIGWYIPLSRFSETHNGQPLCVAALAAQKQHLALYLMTVYGDPRLERSFRAGFKAAGKKLDMGKSCVRFKTADALALDVIGETISKVPADRYIAAYAKVREGTRTGAKAKAVQAKAAKKATATKATAARATVEKITAAKTRATKARGAKARATKALIARARVAKARPASTKRR